MLIQKSPILATWGSETLEPVKHLKLILLQLRNICRFWYTGGCCRIGGNAKRAQILLKLLASRVSC